jgi:serine/threonine protein kinase
MTTLVGTSLGKYQIEDRLGRGGMAEVYKAFQPALQRYVAIKVIHPHLAEDTDFVARFEREAHAVAKLHHPYIVQVYDFEMANDVYYMVMELLSGETLKTKITELHHANERMAVEDILSLVDKISSAIDYAHEQGIIHRDLKPANIIYNEKGEPILTDFGVAKILGTEKLTQTGLTSGTPAYMSPEQGVGDEADARSDVYSFGVIVYELLAGVVPYEAETPFALIMQHVTAPLPSLRSVMPHYPPDVDRVIAHALAKKPDDRYQTAAEFARDLRSAFVGEPVVAPPIKPPARSKRSQRILIGAIAIAALVLITIVVTRAIGFGQPIDQSLSAAATQAVIHSMAAPAHPDDVKFVDDFSDSESGWPISDGQDSRSYDNGQYHIKETSPSVAIAGMMTSGPRFHQFHATIDATLIEGQPESGYGLVFDYQDAQNYYVFGINGLGQISVWALKQGAWHELRNLPDKQQWTMDSHVKPTGEVNHLEITRTDTKITASVNGSIVIQVDDTSFTFGGVGFYVATSSSAANALADVRFDNLTIDPVAASMTP